jgi:hypothetical protein
MPRRPRVLIASAPGDPRAVRLADDLQDMGLDVVLADTPEIAEDYLPELNGMVCVAVLRARLWNTPAISIVVRAGPPVLIPVLAEQMALPRGPWSFEPIPMETPRQAVQEVAEAVEGAWRTLADRRPSRPRPDPFAGGREPFDRTPPDPYGRDASGSFPPRSDPTGRRMAAGGPMVGTRGSLAAPRSQARPPAKKSSGSRPVVISIISVVLVAALIGGAVRYGSSVLRKLGLLKPVVTTATAPLPYSTNLPGPGCDTGGGVWSASSPVDTSVASKCLSTGFQITKNSNFSTAAEYFFNGKNQAPFPASYHVEVKGTITAGDATTSVGLEVHRQNPRGGHLLSVQPQEWNYTLFNTAGEPMKTLGLGFFQKAAQVFTVGVDVTGGVMSVSINGTKVDTVYDTTYNTTNSIAIVLSDGSATKPISAVFSDFVYQPFTTATIPGTPDVQATATAVVKAYAPYTAANPGPSCDKGTGQWDPIDLGDVSTKIQCAASGLSVSQPSTASDLSIVRFYYHDGNFPANYKIAVNMDMTGASPDGCSTASGSQVVCGCGGIFWRDNAQNGSSYHATVCSDGTWRIRKITPTASTNLDTNQVFLNSLAPVQIVITSIGAVQTLSIDGTTVSTQTDAATPLTETDFVSLFLTSGSSTSTIIFSNFAFTPLP